MKRYSKLITAAALVALLALGSCKDFLSIDKYFDDQLRMDSVFLSPRYFEAYMWGAASYFPDEGSIFGGSYVPGPMATDEAFSLHYHAGMDFVLGNINSDNLSSMNIWNSMYIVIRKCNTIFARIDGVPGLERVDKIRIMAYTHFIRAYAYYNLLRSFGPPILLYDDLIDVNLAIEDYNLPRATFDEAVDYICNEFEIAAKDLPTVQPIIDFGLPPKGAAYALVARLRLMQASPMFNGGDIAKLYYNNWIRPAYTSPAEKPFMLERSYPEAHYISQDDSDTTRWKRWQIAAAAAKRVMTMSGGNYSLHIVAADEETPPLGSDGRPDAEKDMNFYNNWEDGGAGNIDHYRSYSELFNGESPMTTNPELIWARRSAATLNSTQTVFPATIGGSNSLCVTQKVVDAYLMDNGLTIAESQQRQGGYTEDGYTTRGQTFSGYRLNMGVSNMYANREKRFYASIGFSECVWPCLSTQIATSMNQTIRYYYDSSNGKTGPSNPLDYPITGYVLKKFVHPQDSWSDIGSSKRIEKLYPIIRYAEILLSYAEALNNLSGATPYAIPEDQLNGLAADQRLIQYDVDEIRKAFNQVRYRAGLPGLNATQAADPEEVQRQIERERMVEFLCENHRYYDVRRWGIYEDVENEPIMGMNTDAVRNFYYQRTRPNTTRIAQRKVDRKMIFLPIPRVEIKRLPLCDQNPGWE
jgi:hypothetical protein